MQRCCLGLLLIAVLAGCERATAPALSYNESNSRELRKMLQAGQASAESSADASAAEPTGWATISGKFTLAGNPPPRSPLQVNKDVEVCAPGFKQVLEESLVIGPGNGIQNVLIFLGTPIPQDNSKWVHESYNELATQELLFDQKNCVFLSHVAAMWFKQKAKVMNSDPVGHNTNLDSKRGAAAANFTVPANSFAYYEPGRASPAPFGVSCSIHPWMTAWMMVCESPYFAVTKEDGSFEIKNLPAGVPLELRVWQEKAGFLQSVTLNGQATKWNKGRFKVNLTADQPLAMDVAVDATVFQ